MYLSRLILKPRSRRVQRELADPYEMHRTLLNAFPNGKIHVERKDDDAVGLLFRLDEDPRQGLISVLVQSKTAPDWGFLAGKADGRGQPYLLPPEQMPDDKPNPAVTEFDLASKLRPGQTLAFRLRANPTKRLGKDAGEHHHQRVGLLKEEEQLNWLKRKIEAAGGALLSARISGEAELRGKLFTEKDVARRMRFVSAQFDGILQVVDADKMHAAIANGIGSAKGFGFGMLSLAPA